ncbi:MAG: hypothetical protein H8E82_01560 [Candidatus Marinimicrobia bacterium]|nr:hypothetical protein [Candidatus Neomarinimicrobiota bacterium]
MTSSQKVSSFFYGSSPIRQKPDKSVRSRIGILLQNNETLFQSSWSKGVAILLTFFLVEHVSNTPHPAVAGHPSQEGTYTAGQSRTLSRHPKTLSSVAGQVCFLSLKSLPAYWLGRMKGELFITVTDPRSRSKIGTEIPYLWSGDEGSVTI